MSIRTTIPSVFYFLLLNSYWYIHFNISFTGIVRSKLITRGFRKILLIISYTSIYIVERILLWRRKSYFLSALLNALHLKIYSWHSDIHLVTSKRVPFRLPWKLFRLLYSENLSHYLLRYYYFETRKVSVRWRCIKSGLHHGKYRENTRV